MSNIETIIQPREAKIGAAFSVKRILPFRSRRMVGPFCFLDHMGPHTLNSNTSLDVLPHPHIGLSTVTYLFSGQILHRDSLGTQQLIQPGDVNWMKAGKGIVHSERIPQEMQNHEMHGLQAWVALPLHEEQSDPSFSHHPVKTLPSIHLHGVNLSLIAGTLFGQTSPVQIEWPLFYAKLDLSSGSNFQLNPESHESAFYLVSGKVKIGDSILSEPALVVFKPQTEPVIQALSPSIGMLLGGKPLPEPRHIFWNFVASQKELIEHAKAKWKKQEFQKIPGESEFVPLPE